MLDSNKLRFDILRKEFKSKEEKLSYLKELKYKMCDSDKDIRDNIKLFNYLSTSVSKLLNQLENEEAAQEEYYQDFMAIKDKFGDIQPYREHLGITCKILFKRKQFEEELELWQEAV